MKPGILLNPCPASFRWLRFANSQQCGQVGSGVKHGLEGGGRASQQHANARAVAADSAVAVHNHANGDAPTLVAGTVPGVCVHDANHVAKAQRVEPVAAHLLHVRQLDVVITAP